MSEYTRVPTSPEVWRSIKASHGAKLKVFGSYSNPSGNDGISSTPTMFTSYGFGGAAFPIMEAETTWEIDPERPFDRVNEQHSYWLIYVTQEQAENA